MQNYEGNQRTLGYMLQDVASTRRDRNFIYFKDQTVTYGELDDRSNQLGNSLMQMGLTRGDRVGVLLPNCIEYVYIQFGVAKAGMVEVPYNTEAKGTQLTHFLNNSAPAALILDEQYLPLLKSIEQTLTRMPMLIIRSPRPGLPELPFSSKVEAVPFTDLLRGPARPTGVKVSDTDLLAIFYTSGTTGISKGVMLPHNHNWHFPNYLVQQVQMTSDDVVYSPFPYYHGVSQYMATVPALLAGGAVAIAEKFSASRFWEDIRKYHATICWSVYTIPSVLWKQPVRSDDGDNPLRVLFAMGIDPQIQEAFEKRFNVRVVNCYGSTEQNLLFCVPYDNRKTGSSGKRTPDFEVAIVDDHDNILPPGTTGEIVSRPRFPYTQMMGYWGMPEETLKATRNLWMHSGELGYVDKVGWFYFAGRSKDSIRKGGENVSAAEVESAVAEHPGVLECAVVAVPGDLGEDEMKVEVVLRPGKRLSPADLIAYCKGKMARHMVPRYVRMRDKMPKTGTEKIQKAVLKEEGLTQDTWDSVLGRYVSGTGKAA